MSNKTVRCLKGERLAYYRAQATAGYWDNHWQKVSSTEFYRRAIKGELDWFEKPFVQYLPPQGKILEAGCGLAQYVLALRVRGYNAEGVEWGVQTVDAVKKKFPDLPVRVGDVTRLSVPDEYYQGYISLGVVEHCYAGPQQFLQEAYRVLSPGGIAIFSVPFFHPLRQLKAKVGAYRQQPDNMMQFYQYAFTMPEFSTLVQAANFKVIDAVKYDGLKGLQDELPWLRQLFRLPGLWRLAPRFSYSRFGHMLLLVCQK